MPLRGMTKCNRADKVRIRCSTKTTLKANSREEYMQQGYQNNINDETSAKNNEEH